jgi:Flp pilus assembly protein TadG
MNARLSNVRGEGGQAIVFMVFALLTIVGMAAIVVDGGRWFQAQRHLQTAADAAALAGAQDLPNTSTASASATSYAQTNWSGISATPSFPSDSPCVANACIDVAAVTSAPGTLAKIYGSIFSNVTVRAHARAMVSVPLFMKDVAPIAVKTTSACPITDPSCFGRTVTVSFTESQLTTSAIGLIDLRCQSSTSSVNCGQGPGADTLRNWIECTPCYPDALPANKWYSVKTGQNTGPIQQGLNDAANARRTLIFPVFDTADSTVPSFHVIAWAAFLIDVGGVTWSPSSKSIRGHFTTLIATDLAAGSPIAGASDFGVHTITLIQ